MVGLFSLWKGDPTMFERLFTRDSTVARYHAAPLARSRLRYLAHCAERGLARATLRTIAANQVAVVRLLDLQEAGQIPRARIEAAAWLRFAGRLACPAAPETPHADKLAAFADFLRGERGLSERTVGTYSDRAGDFLRRHCGGKHALEDVAIADIDRALEEQATRGLARTTIRSYATALRAFFRYAQGRGWSRPGLAEAIPAPRVYAGESVPAGPAWEDVRRLVACTAGDRPADLRDRAILLLLTVYGLRAGEVRGLRLDDIDWGAQTLRVRRPKPGRTHLYPLSRTVGDAILRYLREVRPRCAWRAVFLTVRGPARPLGESALWPVVGLRLRHLGIQSKRSGPHALRHAFAQRLLDKGFSMKEIGDCLGHRSPASTAIYAKVDLAGLREVADFDLEGLA
jgi:site-specific recombinase XerD